GKTRYLPTSSAWPTVFPNFAAESFPRNSSLQKNRRRESAASAPYSLIWNLLLVLREDEKSSCRELCEPSRNHRYSASYPEPDCTSRVRRRDPLPRCGNPPPRPSCSHDASYMRSQDAGATDSCAGPTPNLSGIT